MGLFSNDESNHYDHRNSDREDLLRQVKLLTDKVHQMSEALKREELEKHHERTIMRKTHETQLEIKNSLIRNLEDIIDEQEARLFNLQSHLNGIGPLSPKTAKPLGGVTRLRNEIEELSKKNVELTESLLREQQQRQKLNEDLDNTRHQVLQNHAEGEILQAYSEYQRKLLQLEKEKALLKSETEALKEKAENFEADNQRLRLEYERLDVKFSEYSLNSDHQQRDLQSQLVEERENYESVVAALKRDLEKAKHVDAQSKAENEQTEIRLQQARDALMNVQNENRTLQAAVIDFDAISVNHQTELQHWKASMAELERALEKKTEEFDENKKKLEKEVERLKNSLSRMRRETTSWQQRHADAIIALDCFRASLKSLRQEQKELLETSSMMPQIFLTQFVAVKNQVCDALLDKVGDLAARYRREILLRKQYHNQLIELKGNIRVFARVRPVIPFDTDQTCVVEADDCDDTVLSVYNNGRKQTFNLDKVFGPQHSQEDVFAEVRPLITSVLDGYNVCIFAYGQTGSGKTYTMEGPLDNPGINQRALTDLFNEISFNRVDWKFSIMVSMLEIYNETIHDLLSDGPDIDKLDVKMNSDGYLYVPGLTSIEVNSLAEINKVFQLGRENRATASTNMNEHSSRSHALLCVKVESVHRTTQVKTNGRLNLVDLAGSERVSKSAACGDRLKEAQCINKSLSALGDVIWALKNQHQHIPFRNSKLTYLLQDSLGGNSKTLMVVQVAPVASHVGESVCSLNFAHRVRCVELGAATASKTPSQTNGSSVQEDASPYQFTRSPSKNLKSRNGFQKR